MATDTSQGALEAMASRILTRLRQPFRIGLIEVYTGCSLGIALAPQHGDDRESVIRNADTAYVHRQRKWPGQILRLLARDEPARI
ncbi:diguanylate cyclase domain-containing protein [Enterobacter hormaechei]